MRNLMCLMLVLSGLALGCGSDGDGKDNEQDMDNATGDGDTGDGDTGTGDGDTGTGDGDTGTGDGDTGTGDGDTGTGDGDTGTGDGDMGGDGDIVIDPPSDGGDKYPMCPRADIPDPMAYTGSRPFSQEEAQECATKCMNNADCFFACPGAETWAMCVQTEAIACTSGKGGVCRGGHDNAICCQNQEAVVTKCTAIADETAQGECFYNECKADFDAYFNMCVFDQTKPAAAECVNAARMSCFGNDPDEAPEVPEEMPRVKPSQQLLQMAPALLQGLAL